MSGVPIWQRPTVRAGIYAWALIGIVAALAFAVLVVGQLQIIVVPLLLALFPAALLTPLVRLLRRAGLRPAVASLVVLVGSVALVAGVVRILAPSVADEIPRLGESLVQGAEDLRGLLESGPFNFEIGRIEDLVAQGKELFSDWLRESGVQLATAVAEGVAGLLFGFVALFFYLKDGARIAAWLRDLFPERLRADAETIGERTWFTLGAYFRGQLLVAFVDAVFIGLGLWLLGVPLVLPLAVLVFFGGLFPIVGAFLSGAVAVLVALADGGAVIALATLAIVMAVQQLESNVLAPVVLGRATELHPLAVIVALTAGGVTLGVLGAFIAVPVVASAARGIGHLRTRVAG